MNISTATPESLILGAREWTAAAAILLLACVALAVWSYAARNRLSGLRFLAMFLKISAAAALAFCLLEPMKRIERPRPGANVLALVVDNSRSMEIQPPGAVESRVDRIRSDLQSDSVWQSRLAQDFDVRRYAFDEQLRAVQDLEELEFQGTQSSLSGSLTTLAERFQSRPVAGLILFTDGLATDDVRALLDTADQWSFPIYPVLYGEAGAVKDISVTEAAVSISTFELAPAGVQATIQASGLAGESIVVRLIDSNGQTLERQVLSCNDDDFEQKVRFQFKPTDTGFQLVQLRAMLDADDSDKPEVNSRSEVTVANNSKLIAVDKGGQNKEILYVSGRPNWEGKFLRRALEEDLELKFSGLIRVARKEPKFSFRDQGFDSSNPLLAGFEDDEETKEQYDEPVLLKIGEQASALESGFPSGEEDLFSYDAIILDDVEAAFFSPQQLMLLRRFVSERGGGLMMLGGQESFLGGGYKDTPLGDVLPVYLRGQEARGKDQPVRYRLTREGSLEPWLRLRSNQSEEEARFSQMPDFKTWNTVADVKPGASTLAQLQTASGVQPGLVAQRFGKGRALALLVGDFWRWSMRRASEDSDDLAQSWRQIVRWLTADVPQRLEVDVEAPKAPTDPHRASIKVRDAAFKPMDNATLALEVTEPDETRVTVTATQDQERPGVYVAEYWSRMDGGYRLEVSGVGPDGEELIPVTTGWTAQPSASEFANVEPDMELLAELARKSGGETVPIDRLNQFANSLPTKKVPVTEFRVEPLWHRPWLALFAIGALCIEWGLRRWKGLP